jgi:hypothetical protein
MFQQKAQFKRTFVLQGCVNARFEISKVAEDAFFELFHILDGLTKTKASDLNTRARTISVPVEPVPEDTCDAFTDRDIRKRTRVARRL